MIHSSVRASALTPWSRAWVNVVPPPHRRRFFSALKYRDPRWSSTWTCSLNLAGELNPKFTGSICPRSLDSGLRPFYLVLSIFEGGAKM